MNPYATARTEAVVNAAQSMKVDERSNLVAVLRLGMPGPYAELWAGVATYLDTVTEAEACRLLVEATTIATIVAPTSVANALAVHAHRLVFAPIAEVTDDDRRRLASRHERREVEAPDATQTRSLRRSPPAVDIHTKGGVEVPRPRVS